MCIWKILIKGLIQFECVLINSLGNWIGLFLRRDRLLLNDFQVH